MPDFIPGRELSRRFYFEAVRPILNAAFPNLAHAAALVGPGSDVLGFDTPMSTDHDWGPRMFVLLRDEDAALAPTIHEALRQRLPRVFHGYPVSAFEEPGDAPVYDAGEGPVEHRVVVRTLRSWLWSQLEYDLDRPLEAADWLTFASQALREIVAGPVHYDNVGELTGLRQRLAYYPHDVWLYMLAAGWQRIGQEEHLMPRAGYVDDELGSALMGSRLARDVMQLCFLMERQYAPYPKWYGTAFKQLACGPGLLPVLWSAQRAERWQEREASLGESYEYLARMHNALGLTEPLHTKVAPFYTRPFNVIHGSMFAEALRARIVDPDVQRIAARRLIGSVDQFSDNTDLRSHVAWRHILRNLYTEDVR
jgi:hypothetical protein